MANLVTNAPLVIIESSEAYHLDDPIHVQRWMCKNCGLVFDYQFNPEETDGAGWPKADPPWDMVYDWQDEQGNWHFEEPERSEMCPRCTVSLEEIPPVPIIVRETKKLDDFMEAGQGEGQTLEVKQDFSRNNLRKTIAAFSTSQGGRIVLGIDKKYRRVGYQGQEKLDTPNGKEELQIRLRDKVLNVIKPPPTVRVDFFSEGGKNYAVITVIKGPSPVYYSANVPYVRDLDQSRPATPDEVQALYKE